MSGGDLTQRIAMICLVTLFSLVLCAPLFAAPSCVVITAAGREVESLSVTDIERIFLGKMKKWPDGAPITLVYNDEKAVKATFSQNYLHRSWRQISIFWRKKLYSGQSMLPIFVTGDNKVKEYLVDHPHAISYLSIQSVDSRVQVLEMKP